MEIIRIVEADELVSAQEYRDTVTIRVEQFFPDHEPRDEDPHYSVFRAARKQLKKDGRLVCFICGAENTKESPIELHHHHVEWSLQNGVDLEKFFRCHDTEVKERTREELSRWTDSIENVLPLCQHHHRGAGGIHCLPHPQWIIQRYWDTSLPPAARKATALGEVVFLSNSDEPISV